MAFKEFFKSLLFSRSYHDSKEWILTSGSQPITKETYDILFKNLNLNSQVFLTQQPWSLITPHLHCERAISNKNHKTTIKQTSKCRAAEQASSTDCWGLPVTKDYQTHTPQIGRCLGRASGHQGPRKLWSSSWPVAASQTSTEHPSALPSKGCPRSPATLCPPHYWNFFWKLLSRHLCFPDQDLKENSVPKREMI